MTSETISPGKGGAKGMPVSINSPQTYGQQLDRSRGRVERLTAKLKRQKDVGAPADRIEETEAAIKQWSRKLKAIAVLLGEDD